MERHLVHSRNSKTEQDLCVYSRGLPGDVELGQCANFGESLHISLGRDNFGWLLKKASDSTNILDPLAWRTAFVN